MNRHDVLLEHPGIFAFKISGLHRLVYRLITCINTVGERDLNSIGIFFLGACLIHNLIHLIKNPAVTTVPGLIEVFSLSKLCGNPTEEQPG